MKDQLAAADVLIGISSTVITPPGPGELSVTVGIIRTWTQSVTQQETLDTRAANESSAKFSQYNYEEGAYQGLLLVESSYSY